MCSFLLLAATRNITRLPERLIYPTLGAATSVSHPPPARTHQRGRISVCPGHKISGAAIAVLTGPINARIKRSS